ncbi:MAG: NADPH-dependent FMN reductase [Acidimicrobiia bacterium]
MGLIAINASHSTGSTTHNLAMLATEVHGSGDVYDLAALDPAALVGVGKDATVTKLLEAIPQASVLVFVTPIYRATYSGLLKIVLDQLPQAALRGIPVVLAATAASPAHFLALDTGGRALVASLEGWTVPTVVYATPADFDDDKRPLGTLRDQMTAALTQAKSIAER